MLIYRHLKVKPNKTNTNCQLIDIYIDTDHNDKLLQTDERNIHCAKIGS